MKKMFGRKLALVLVLGGVFALSACSSGDNDEEPVVKNGIVARMTTVTSELTFYEGGIVEFKEDTAAARAVSARAVTANAKSSSGTYEGDVMKDGATVSLNFTSGKRTGEKGTATINERDNASNISMTIGNEKDIKLERIQVLVTAWRTSSGKTVYFYNDNWAMQVIRENGKTTCHPLVYTGNAGKGVDVKLALLDSVGEKAKSKDAIVYDPVTISGDKMTYNDETYTKIDNDRTIVSAWRAETKSKSGKKFLETMYFYSDKTFMIVMNKVLNIIEEELIITNGFAGTYTGDTTKDGPVTATIEQFVEMYPKGLPGTIEGKKLTISKPEKIDYGKIN